MMTAESKERAEWARVDHLRIAWACCALATMFAVFGWWRTVPPEPVITNVSPAAFTPAPNRVPLQPLPDIEGLPPTMALRSIPPFRVIVEAPSAVVTKYHEAVCLRLRTLGLPVDALGYEAGRHDSELRFEVFDGGCWGMFKTTVERAPAGEKDKRLLQYGTIWSEFRKTPDECVTAFANAYLAANPKK